jgi:hypothetical protein
LNNKLLLKFFNNNTVTKLKDIEYKTFKIFIEDLL